MAGSTKTIRAARIVADGRVIEGGAVVIADGVIIEVHDGLSAGAAPAVGVPEFGQVPGGDVEDLGAVVVLAGFVDQHCHGGGRGDFFAADPGQIQVAADTHLRHGTTTIIASLVTATTAELLDQIAVLRPMAGQEVVAGIHLEGPWISPAECGAHDVTLLRPPDPSEVAALLAAGGGAVRMVTLAPELPGGLAAIRQVVAAGAVAAIGHTAADFETTVAAIDAGATVATHLLNRMPVLHKREPGPVLALMRDRRVTCELIIDGVHLHPGIVEFVIDHVGPDRVAAVTDAMAAAGAGDGRYQIGHLEVDVADGVARLADDGDGAGPEAAVAALAGSVLTADKTLRILVSACGQDLVAASQMLSATPARAMGFTDRGHIAVGQRADLVVLDDGLQVTRVMRAGDWIP